MCRFIPGYVLHYENSSWQSYNATLWHWTEKIFSRPGRRWTRRNRRLLGRRWSRWRRRIPGCFGICLLGLWWWVYDDAGCTWYERRLQGRQTRRGKGKGRRKGKGKGRGGRRFFRSRKGKAEGKEQGKAALTGWVKKDMKKNGMKEMNGMTPMTGIGLRIRLLGPMRICTT